MHWFHYEYPHLHTVSSDRWIGFWRLYLLLQDITFTRRSFPKNYWNKIAFCGPNNWSCAFIMRLSHRMDLDSKRKMALISWQVLMNGSSAVHAELGPDGALWTDCIILSIQHNPTPDEVSKNGEAMPTSIHFVCETTVEYIEWFIKVAKIPRPLTWKTECQGVDSALKSDNMFFWRLTAQAGDRRD